jgi:hypothetical protein
MLLTLQEDGVLRVYDTTTAAEIDVEALDAAETFRLVFDDAAVPHRIDWIADNSSLGMGSLRIVTNGEYRLVPSGPPDPKALADLLESVELVEPRSREPEVRDLARSLRAHIADGV